MIPPSALQHQHSVERRGVLFVVHRPTGRRSDTRREKRAVS
jgi:hypothetical protein